MNVVVTDAFDGIDTSTLLRLKAAAAGGRVTLALWDDQLVERQTGRPPRFPLSERRYMARAVRWVSDVKAVSSVPADATLLGDLAPANLPPVPPCPHDPPPTRPGGRKVLVTGCFDLLHSGHVRFFESAAQFGDLYVVVGHDVNIRALKGEGRPLVPEAQRRFQCDSIRHVTAALVSTGDGWLDAAPEIERLRPDWYLVNEDGDRPEKAAFCAEHGVEYVVLPRKPAPGLAARSSTALRAARGKPS